MLRIGNEVWAQSSGALELLQFDERGTLTAAISCKIGTLPFEWVLLDTGSEHTIISHETAESLGNELSFSGQKLKHSSRFGKCDVQMASVSITLRTDMGPEVMIQDVSVLVHPSWSGPTVIGVRPIFERLKIGLEPSREPGIEGRIYFGT